MNLNRMNMSNDYSSNVNLTEFMNFDKGFDTRA